MRKIRRLHDDLGLDRAGVEVALRLLDEIPTPRRSTCDADADDEEASAWR